MPTAAPSSSTPEEGSMESAKEDGPLAIEDYPSGELAHRWSTDPPDVVRDERKRERGRDYKGRSSPTPFGASDFRTR